MGVDVHIGADLSVPQNSIAVLAGTLLGRPLYKPHRGVMIAHVRQSCMIEKLIEAAITWKEVRGCPMGFVNTNPPNVNVLGLGWGPLHQSGPVIGTR